MTSDAERMEQELEHLVAKARRAARAAAATASQRSHRRQARRRAIALLCAAVLLIAAVAAWAVFGRSPAGVRAYSAISQAGQGIVQAIDRHVARFFDDGSGAPPASPDPFAVSSVRVRRVSHSPAPRIGGAQVPVAVPPAPILPSTLPPPASAVLILPAEVLETDAEPDSEPGPLYTAQDAGVAPPLALPPLVGRPIAGGGASMPGDIDVIVSRTGTVERVRLLAPNAFQDGMLLAAIKNQRFRPALAHGRPVRYLLRMRAAS